MDYKNSIRLGIQFESKNDVKGKLETIITELNNNKITLDLTLKNNNIVQTLENLNKILDVTKSKMGEGVSLGNVDKAINQAFIGVEKLNGALQKQSTINYNDGTKKTLSETSQGIGQVRKEIEILNKEGVLTSSIAPTNLTNYTKMRTAIEDITKAQKQLNALESNGFSDTNKINKLRTSFDSKPIKSDEELRKLLNEVNNLTSTESKVIEYSNKLRTLKASMANLTDDKFSKDLDVQAFEKIGKEIDKAQTKLKNFDGTNLNGLKQQFLELDNSVSNLSNKTIDSHKSANLYEKDEVKKEQTRIANIQKEIDLNNKLVASENKRQVKDDKSNVNKLQQENELLQKQKQAYEQIKVLKTNKVINTSEISKLEQITKSATSIGKINEALNSIGKSTSRESSISALTKQITEAQTKLEKMKSSFGTKLPNGFIESTESELKKLSSELKKVDGVNFNGIKNSLGTVKSSMEQTNAETKQLVSSLKETNNGGFFSGVSTFLGKIGVFYGIQQVVQEITIQLKNASEYTLTMDKAFTNMRMITGKSKENISSMVDEYKKLGAELHTTNKDMMGGMEEVTRAGFEGAEGKALMSASVIGSKVSGQSTEATTQQLIAIKNAFDMTGQSMQGVVDMISKMDNVSATSFAEISEAIKYTAFSAREAGTPLSNLVAYITTVSEKTRKSATTIGESFKTIYARYSTIKLGNLDENGKSINDTEKAMGRIGIQIRSSKGQFKEFDVVLQEFMNKYKSGQLSQVDYLAGIQSLSGTRKQNASYVEKFA